MKEFAYLRKGCICLGVQALAWLVFTGVDYLEEAHRINLWMAAFLGIPIAALVLYFIFRKWLYKRSVPKVRDVAIFLGNWLLVAVILLVIITELTCVKNTWIVHQATGGWENFLNGIEYPLFGVFYGAGVPIVIILGELLILLIRAVSKSTGSMEDEKTPEGIANQSGDSEEKE